MLRIDALHAGHVKQHLGARFGAVLEAQAGQGVGVHGVNRGHFFGGGQLKLDRAGNSAVGDVNGLAAEHRHARHLVAHVEGQAATRKGRAAADGARAVGAAELDVAGVDVADDQRRFPCGQRLRGVGGRCDTAIQAGHREVQHRALALAHRELHSAHAAQRLVQHAVIKVVHGQAAECRAHRVVFHARASRNGLGEGAGAKQLAPGRRSASSAAAADLHPEAHLDVARARQLRVGAEEAANVGAVNVAVRDIERGV